MGGRDQDRRHQGRVASATRLSHDVIRDRHAGISETLNVQPSPQSGAVADPRHGPRFRRGGDQAAGAQAAAPGGAGAAAAGGGARQDRGDGAAHARAIRGSRRRRRRQPHLLHRHRGARRRRPRRRRRAGADVDAGAGAVRPADDGGATGALLAAVPRGAALSPRARRARGGSRCRARHQLSPPSGERRAFQDDRGARGRWLGRQRQQGRRRRRIAGDAVRRARERRRKWRRYAAGAAGHAGLERDHDRGRHAHTPRRLRHRSVRRLPRAGREFSRSGKSARGRCRAPHPAGSGAQSRNRPRRL